MQEKTLEEEFKAIFGSYWSKVGDNAYIVDPINNGRPIILSQEGIINFISSREEKAREEGRKEGFKLGVEDRDEYWKAYPIGEAKYEAITQYKEELLSKLPSERNPFLAKREFAEGKVNGWNKCLSEIKKLL
jgi:hypothetical protein